MPNQLTGIRLVLAIVLFVLIAFGYYLTGMVVFIVAAATDWIDGYYARQIQPGDDAGADSRSVRR